MKRDHQHSRIPEKEFQNCIDVLRSGGTILYPTDTVWGIGCDARNEKAVDKIYAIKKRNESKSLIVLLQNESLLNKYVHEVPGVAWDLIELSEKPLTIIYDKVGGMASNVIAEDGSCGIRICKDEFCNTLLHKFGRPLVSTSANISGKTAPHNYGEISDEIKKAVDYVVDWRQGEHTQSEPSTLIRLRNDGQVQVIRK